MSPYAHYTAEEAALIVGLVAGLARFGRRPTLRRAGLAALGAVGLFAYVSALTVVLSGEGNDARLLLLTLFGGWLLLAFTPGRNPALGLAIALTLATIGLRFQFVALAHSNRYTDNPQVRMVGVRYRQRHPSPLRPPEPREVVVEPNTFTWLTGLYSVVPPTGGATGG